MDNINQISQVNCNNISSVKPDNNPLSKSDTITISSAQEEQKDWTILLYMNNNNSLSWQGEAKLKHQLYQIDKSDKVNIVVDFSALSQKGWTELNAINSKYIEIRNKGKKIIKELGQTNMASPDSLADFVVWAMENYKSEHYMVVLQGHGRAWHGALVDDVYKHRMTLPEIDSAFEKIKDKTGKIPDVIAFDCCMMANMEVAHQIKNHAKIMIGSEEVEIGNDNPDALEVTVPYKKIFNTLSKKADNGIHVTPEELAKDWVMACEGKWTTPTQSAIDLTKIDGLSGALDELAKSILTSKTSIDDIKAIAEETKHMCHEKLDEYYKHDDYRLQTRDLHEFLQKLISDLRITDENINKLAQNALKVLNEVIIANEAGSDYIVYSPIMYSDELHETQEHFKGDRNHGLSIFIPTDPLLMQNLEKEYPVKYEDINFAKDTAWGELVKVLSK